MLGFYRIKMAMSINVFPYDKFKEIQGKLCKKNPKKNFFLKREACCQMS